jgi:L-rhamnose mutarotase
MSTRYCFALDLKDDPKLIAAYEEHHRNVWPEIIASIRDSGITSLDIYRVSNRLFMIMDVDDTFSFERKGEMDSRNGKVQQWEELMWQYQQPLPVAAKGEKWMLMENIFKLSDF